MVLEELARRVAALQEEVARLHAQWLDPIQVAEHLVELLRG